MTRYVKIIRLTDNINEYKNTDSDDVRRLKLTSWIRNLQKTYIYCMTFN